MIYVVANLHLKPGGWAGLRPVAEELVHETRKEAGCLRYELTRSESNPQHLAFLETWESAAHLAAHEQSEHFKRLVPQMGAHCESAPPAETFGALL